MNPVATTAHAASRMRQRGIRESELELALALATEVPDGFIVLERDVRALEREAKRLVQSARKLAGKRFVVESNKLITAYHASDRATRALLLAARDRNLL